MKMVNKKMNCTVCTEAPYHTITFKHEYSLFIVNLWEITAVKIKDCCVKQGGKNTPGKHFIWGRYSLVVQHLKCWKKGKLPAEKTLPRSYSLVFNPPEGRYKNAAVDYKGSLVCHPVCSYSVAPVSFFLLPLLSKMNYLPFKVKITVRIVVKIPLETLGNGQQPEKIEVAKKELETKRLDPGEKKEAVGEISTPSPQYYRTYRFFYERFYGN